VGRCRWVDVSKCDTGSACGYIQEHDMGQTCEHVIATHHCQHLLVPVSMSPCTNYTCLLEPWACLPPVECIPGGECIPPEGIGFALSWFWFGFVMVDNWRIEHWMQR
jgi:hypothetical protein